MKLDFEAGYHDEKRVEFPEILQKYKRIPVKKDGKLLTPDKSRNLDRNLYRKKVNMVR